MKEAPGRVQCDLFVKTIGEQIKIALKNSPVARNRSRVNSDAALNHAGGFLGECIRMNSSTPVARQRDSRLGFIIPRYVPWMIWTRTSRWKASGSHLD